MSGNEIYAMRLSGILTLGVESLQFGRYVNVSALKHYFNVSNSYVINKLFLVLFPWRHKGWSRKQAVGANGQEGWYLPPRDDINSPDMYIPGGWFPLSLSRAASMSDDDDDDVCVCDTLG